MFPKPLTAELARTLRSRFGGILRALGRDYHRRSRASIKPAAKAQNAATIPTPSKINSQDQPFMREYRDMPLLRPDDPFGVDELGIRSTRCLLSNSGPKPLGLFPLPFKPFRAEGFGGECALAGVDAPRVPILGIGAKTLAMERSIAAGRVSSDEPDRFAICAPLPQSRMFSRGLPTPPETRKTRPIAPHASRRIPQKLCGLPAARRRLPVIR